MPTYPLTDLARDLWVENFSLSAADLNLATPHSWSVTKRTLRGGRREGVDLVQVDTGTFSFSVLPTRGMGIWKGNYHGDRVGWVSPVKDGPINPAFVNLMNWGGLGWLEGFDELLVRCGLENNGAPYSDKSVNPDGTERHTLYGLHGKIANIPASLVTLHVSDKAPYEITLEGHVDETKIFGPQLRMTTKITTVPGSNKLTVVDLFTNMKDVPCDMQVLYHWNFGPPQLEEGSRLVAPIKTLVPRDPRAQEGLGHFDVYGAPEPGFAEQAYFMEMQAKEDGKTLAMLRNRAGDKAVALRFNRSQLPCFTLWKCTSGHNEGYVTGLEPATNFPNPKPFEKERNRVVTLPPGGSHTTETTLEILNTTEAVSEVEAEIQALAKLGSPTIHRNPVEPFTREG